MISISEHDTFIFSFQCVLSISFNCINPPQIVAPVCCSKALEEMHERRDINKKSMEVNMYIQAIIRASECARWRAICNHYADSATQLDIQAHRRDVQTSHQLFFNHFFFRHVEHHEGDTFWIRICQCFSLVPHFAHVRDHKKWTFLHPGHI